MDFATQPRSMPARAKIVRPAYRVIKGPLPNLVTVELAGLWEAADFRGFIPALGNAVRTLPSPNAYMLMVDLCHFPIQTQAIMAMFRENIREKAHFHRCATLITPQSPVVLQLRRLIAGDVRIKLFESRECAHDWLRSPMAANQAA